LHSSVLQYCNRNSISLIIPAVEPFAVRFAGAAHSRSMSADAIAVAGAAVPVPSQLRRIRDQLQPAHQQLPGERLRGTQQLLAVVPAAVGSVGEPAAAAAPPPPPPPPPPASAAAPAASAAAPAASAAAAAAVAAAAAAEVMTTQRHTIATLQNRVGRLEGWQRKKKNEDRFAATFAVKRIRDGFPLRVVRCVRACICVSVTCRNL
jgi:hypothetical protein